MIQFEIQLRIVFEIIKSNRTHHRRQLIDDGDSIVDERMKK
jgi:hypothetical protein